MKAIISALILSGIMLIACGDDYATNQQLPPELLNARERLIVAGNILELSSWLQRDFMPICPPDGKPLRAHIVIYDINDNPIPLYIRPDSLWAVMDGEIWADELTNIRWSPAEDTIHCGNYDGPKWPPGRAADVIIKLLYINKAYYLKAEDQVIFRTD